MNQRNEIKLNSKQLRLYLQITHSIGLPGWYMILLDMAPHTTKRRKQFNARDFRNVTRESKT